MDGTCPGAGAVARLLDTSGTLDELIFVSVDDHIIEPADMFEGRLTASNGGTGVTFDAAAEMADVIAQQPPRAVRYAKELLRKSRELPLAAGVEVELDALLTLLADRQPPP